MRHRCDTVQHFQWLSRRMTTARPSRTKAGGLPSRRQACSVAIATPSILVFRFYSGCPAAKSGKAGPAEALGSTS